MKETPVRELAEADVVVVQRQCTKGNIQAMKQMKEMGMKLVYDLDDDLWGIPGSSPAKRIFAPVRDGFGVCLELCDVVTVSTDSLQSAVRTAVPATRTKDVVVVPNGIDYRYMRPCPLKRQSDKVVVGWGGSNTHAGDVRDAWRVLPRLLEELPQMQLEVVGMEAPKMIQNHPRVKRRHFVPVGEYASRFATWAWDIVLAPLDDVRFNRSKSNIKFLEASAIGAVALGSPVGPYKNFCSLNPAELNWLLCRNSDEWYEKIKALVLDADLRKEKAQQLRKTAEEHFEQSKIIGKWHEVFQRLVA